MPPRSMKAVLQKKLEEKKKELVEQKKSGALGASGLAPSKTVLPPSQSQKRPPSTTHSSEDVPSTKRVKSHASKASGVGGSLPRVEEKEKEKEKKKAAEGETKAPSDIDVPWVPNFITPDKKRILKSDSLQEDPYLAFTLHSGLMLPKDIVAPQSLKAALNDYYFFAGRATQSIMSAQSYLTEHDKQSKLLKQKVELGQITIDEYKKSLDHSEGLRQAKEAQIKTLNDLVKGLQDAAERTRAEGKDDGLAEGRALGRKEMEEEMKRQLQEEFDKGYYQAEEDVADQLMALQMEMKVTQHKESFMLGFNRGLDEAGVEPNDERRSLMEVPPLVVDEAEAEATATGEPVTSPAEQETAATPAKDPILLPSATPIPEA